MATITIREHVVHVDPEDLPLCETLKLRVINKTRHVKKKLYVEHCDRVNGHHVHKSLHRMIMGVTDPKVLVDHIDGNGLNCRRENLRVTDHTGNACNASLRSDNTSGYKGVGYNKKARKWVATIQKDGKRKHVGTFATPELAAEAYARAAEELHGEFMKVR